ncbi:MAG: recombinase family protein [Lachnospiraceae bacterium]|nr:recombinase family protein [Lachnospiraceae bacterium]
MRIAIYSRKSRWTGRGESVENQVLMCREYVECCLQRKNQGISGDSAESVDVEIQVFEDEGFSGKDTNRPQFQRMMREIRSKPYDYLICYRLDRLGRNLADLAALVEELNERRISFISIREQFDTSTPIGKAMLYFAGVLAQMEREQIAERVRDNMLMLSRSGRWLGGNTPLGFVSVEEERIQVDGKRRKAWRLQVNEAEACTVRLIFEQYLKNRSLTKTASYLRSYGIRTRKDREYTADSIRSILQNPVYCAADEEGYGYFCKMGCQVCLEPEEADGSSGFICYAKTAAGGKENPPEKWILAKGVHRGIITGEVFARVQRLLMRNRKKGKGYRVHNEIALLPGILFCKCGCLMRPKYYAVKQIGADGRRRFSYLCPCKAKTHGTLCTAANLQGNKLDDKICAEIISYLKMQGNEQELQKITGKHFSQKTFTGQEEKLFEDIEEKMLDEGKLTDEGKLLNEGKLTDEGKLLGEEISKKEKQIQNLVFSLSSSCAEPEFVREVERKIKMLHQECENLRKSCQRLEMEEGKKRQAEEIRDLKPGTETYLTHLFQALSTAEKRDFLNGILEKIIWDGEKIQIYFGKEVCGRMEFPFASRCLTAPAGADQNGKFPRIYRKA